MGEQGRRQTRLAGLTNPDGVASNFNCQLHVLVPLSPRLSYLEQYHWKTVFHVNYKPYESLGIMKRTGIDTFHERLNLPLQRMAS